ncbi:MAG: MltA domain-containing protein [Caulobacteraceae bacterium]
MRFQLRAIAPAVSAAVWLTACATPRAPAPAPLPPAQIAPQTYLQPWPYPPLPPPPTPALPQPPRNAFADLAGWTEDDHAAALAAFERGCRVTRDPALAGACARALALGPADEARARAFLEANFRPEPAPEVGLLTAYFSPVYEAAPAPGGDFTAPVRPRPADLAAPGGVLGGPYADRAAIEARGTGDALAWMRPEDLFFLQIQGSGVLAFPDGRRMRANFAGTNGAPFVGIAAAMRQAGLLADDDTSAGAIRAWLAANRGERADEIMALDPRYVFFHLAPDDGAAPAGAAGAPLIAGRSVAVDPASHSLGEMVWLDAASPALVGAAPAYRRLAVALDVGGAIKGEARADLYLGEGPAAGLEAGRVRHALRLWRLVPLVQPAW